MKYFEYLGHSLIRNLHRDFNNLFTCSKCNINLLTYFYDNKYHKVISALQETTIVFDNLPYELTCDETIIKSLIE